MYKLTSEQGGERDARLEGPIDAILLNTALNNIQITGSTPAQVNSQYIQRLYCENNRFSVKLKTLPVNFNYRPLPWLDFIFYTSCYVTAAGLRVVPFGLTSAPCESCWFILTHMQHRTYLLHYSIISLHYEMLI